MVSSMGFITDEVLEAGDFSTGEDREREMLIPINYVN